MWRRDPVAGSTPLDAVWHGNPHGRARTAKPRRLEERRARTGDMGCASYPPARCAARYRTSAGTGIFFLESPPFRTTCQAVNLSIHSLRVYIDIDRLTGSMELGSDRIFFSRASEKILFSSPSSDPRRPTCDPSNRKYISYGRFHGRFHGGSTASQTDPP